MIFALLILIAAVTVVAAVLVPVAGKPAAKPPGDVSCGPGHRGHFFMGDDLLCVAGRGSKFHSAQPGMGSVINPSTGLAMLTDGIGGVDESGSSYGIDRWHLESSGFIDPLSSLHTPDGTGGLDAIHDRFGMHAHHFETIFDHSGFSLVNPATGLPMLSESGMGMDIGGNPYGFSNHDHDF